MDLRALVVCPDQDSAKLLMMILAELGLVAEHTPSITHGNELVESQPFDVVVLDYRADQTSEEFLSRLRQSAKNRSSMLVAVVDSEFNARPVFGLGANFVLYRPLSPERTRISLRAARGMMRRERRRAPRTAVHSTTNVAYPGAPEMNAVMSDLSDGGTSIQNVRAGFQRRARCILNLRYRAKNNWCGSRERWHGKMQAAARASAFWTCRNLRGA